MFVRQTQESVLTSPSQADIADIIKNTINERVRGDQSSSEKKRKKEVCFFFLFVRLCFGPASPTNVVIVDINPPNSITSTFWSEFVPFDSLARLSARSFSECPLIHENRRICLDVGGVEHDADGGTERLGREVVAELSADNTGVTCI